MDFKKIASITILILVCTLLIFLIILSLIFFFEKPSLTDNINSPLIEPFTSSGIQLPIIPDSTITAPNDGTKIIEIYAKQIELYKEQLNLYEKEYKIWEKKVETRKSYVIDLNKLNNLEKFKTIKDVFLPPIATILAAVVAYTFGKLGFTVKDNNNRMNSKNPYPPEKIDIF